MHRSPALLILEQVVARRWIVVGQALEAQVWNHADHRGPARAGLVLPQPFASGLSPGQCRRAKLTFTTADTGPSGRSVASNKRPSSARTFTTSKYSRETTSSQVPGFSLAWA